MSATEAIEFLKARLRLNNSTLHTITSMMQQYLQAQNGLDRAAQKRIFVEALGLLAKGQDGVFGTKDDVISEEVFNKVKSIAESGVLEDLFDIAYRYGPQLVESGCFSHCLRRK